MKWTTLTLLAVFGFGCPGETATDEKPDADADADADADTDTDTDVDIDAGDDPATAMAVTATETNPWSWNEVAEGVINPAGDRDFYAIDLVEGAWYFIGINAVSGVSGGPDTVIRIYDPDENMIAENDDLPYWANETNSGIPIRATVTGTYFIEVLDWSDWDEGTSADGSPNHVYALNVLPVESGLPEALEDNDDVASVSAQFVASGGLFDFYGDFWYAWDDDTNFYMTTGTIDEPGDVDVLNRYTEEPLLCVFSNWPNTSTELDGSLTLYREEVVSRLDPEVEGDPYIWELSGDIEMVAHIDSGFDLVGQSGDALAYPATGFANHYLEVASADGAGGISQWYTLVNNCYYLTASEGTDGYYTADAENCSSDPSVEGVSSEINMTESTTTPDYWYGANWGFLDATAGGCPEDDTLDVYVLDEGLEVGNYLFLDGEAGSLLDGTITIESPDGTVLATADEAGEIVNWEITEVPVNLVIESNTGEQGLGQYYVLGVSVYTDEMDEDGYPR